MNRQLRNFKALGWLLAALVLVLAACTPPAEVDDVFGLTVNVVGDGTVTSEPAGIDVGPDGSDAADFAAGTDVVLTATANAGSSFTGWSGACEGAVGNTCTVTMDAAKTATAEFAVDQPQGPFTVSATVDGNGSVTSDPIGIDCPGDCTEEFEAGTSVTFTATPDVDNNFAGWGGDCAGATGDTCTLTVNSDTTVAATFVAQGESITSTYAVAQSSDDAEEFLDDVSTSFPAGSVQTQSSDLDMNWDTSFSANTVVGLRFQNVDIPQGSTIVSATLTFTRDEAGAGSVTYTITAEAADTAETFVYGGTDAPVNNNITGRTTTTASTTWTSDTAWDTTATSSDIASVIQEVVDRGGWASGNALALIVSAAASDASNYRVAVSYDANPAAAPQLTVTYTPPATP